MRVVCHLLPLTLVAIILTITNVAGYKYLIKGREMKTLPEALRELKMFIKDSASLNEKCERYAVLMRSFKRYTLDQFWIADLALQNHNEVKRSIKNMDVDTLRSYYIEAIEKYLATTVDKPMLDLHQCLEANYRERDAKAKKDVKEAVEQYKSFLSQPMSFYLGDKAKHPTLAREDLHPAVAKAILRTFNGEMDRFESHFESKSHHQQSVAQQQQAQAAAFAHPGNGPVPVPAQTELAHEDDELSSSEIEYVKKIIRSLAELYDTLRDSTSAGNRCEAYSRIIEADPSQLGEGLLRNVVGDISKRAGDPKAQNYVFMGNKKSRGIFMLAINLMDPRTTNPGVWFDMMDCVSKWTGEDREARLFLEDPDKRQLIEELTKANKPQQQQVQPQHQQPKPIPQQHIGEPQVAAMSMASASETNKQAEQRPPVVGEPQQPMQQEPAINPTDAWNALEQGERDYVTKVFNTLSGVYQTLPLDAKLNDRCQMYNSVIASDQSKLGNNLAQSLVKDFSKRSAAKQTGNEAFQPKESELENFLFTLSLMDPKDGESAAIWLDMMDCVARWQQGNEMAKSFLAQPGRKELKAEILSAVEQ